jgi:hypothetical protein
VVLLAFKVSMAAWQAAVTGLLVVGLAVDVALALSLTDGAAVELLDAGEEAVGLPVVPMLAPAALTVTVTVWVTVAVAVTVFVTVTSGLAVVVGISGTHSEMKTGSVASTVCTPAWSAASASVAALTAADGSAAPVPPVLPPEGVPVPEGEAVGPCEELVLDVGCRDVEAAFVAAFVVVPVVVDDDA